MKKSANYLLIFFLSGLIDVLSQGRVSSMKNFFAASVIVFSLLFFAAIPGFSAPVEFTILHTSDLHAHLQPWESAGEMVGGYARIKNYKDSLDSEGRNVVMLSSGDVFQGTFFYKFFQGIPDIEFMNRTGYTAMTLGNHEFDSGQESLAEAVSYARFPILAANISFKKIPQLQNKLRPWIMHQIGPEDKPVNIAIIGLIVENLQEIVPAVFVKDLDVIDAAVTLKKYLPEVKKAGADVVIVLAHLGWERELELFEQFPEIDGILGGHTHLETMAVCEGDRGHRFISQTGEWGRGVTRYDLVYNCREDRPLSVTAAGLVKMDSGIPEDETLKTEIEGLWQQIQAKVNIPVGFSKVFLNGERHSIRCSETNLGNLVADCIAGATGVDIAVINGGGIRSSIATGTITIGDCLNVLPFDNFLVKVEMTGAVLLKIFEQVRAAILHEEGFGGFLQISQGLEVRFYQNLVVATFNGQPIDPAATYSVATNDFLSGGGNGLTAFLEANSTESTGILAADAFIKFIKEAGDIDAAEQGRIKIHFKLPKHKMPKSILKIPSAF